MKWQRDDIEALTRRVMVIEGLAKWGALKSARWLLVQRLKKRGGLS